VALLYVQVVRCEFYVEGSTEKWSIGNVEALPKLGATIEHRGKSYLVVDLTGFSGRDVVLVTLRLITDEPALV
jgi:hypothetical protein